MVRKALTQASRLAALSTIIPPSPTASGWLPIDIETDGTPNNPASLITRPQEPVEATVRRWTSQRLKTSLTGVCPCHVVLSNLPNSSAYEPPP